MNKNKKRKSEDHASNHPVKKAKKQWQVPKAKQSHAPSIETGDAGIWATCDMHKEGKCTIELRDFFNEYAAKLYNDAAVSSIKSDSGGGDAEATDADIEAEISKEVQVIKDADRRSLFLAVKIDTPCVLFFKTREPVEPVSFVQRICQDALEDSSLKKTRWVKRLTPVTRIGKATAKSLEEVAKIVLAPVFESEKHMPLKYAIRPTIRNHTVMKRDDVIKLVAGLVGKRHSVDLKNYDHLILVDVYRNVCGMSVVNKDFEKFKRFNLAELYDPTPKLEA
ncbi:MAG: hypothetical protein Q9190_006338 [Brigantiaea leucoxantha]